MKINELIRKYRISRNLTQEQVANYLGVTAPAVNKWEKGAAYPDITLLPALARLLKTDLNTLLSFKDELTQQEIAMFMNQLGEMLYKEKYEKVWEAAMEKIKEYPVCYELILNTALVLDGGLMMLQAAEAEYEKYRADIEKLYERTLDSNNPAVKSQAQSILISRYMERKEYDKAEALLKELPEKNPVDKKQIQAKMYMEYGKWKEAARLEEERLLTASNEVNMSLYRLLDIALIENREEDAKYIADVSQKISELLDLCEYNAYVAPFRFYTAQKDKEATLQILLSMLRSLNKEWSLNSSPLYRHMKQKESGSFGEKFQQVLLTSMQQDEELEFLRDSEEFKRIGEELYFTDKK